MVTTVALPLVAVLRLYRCVAYGVSWGFGDGALTPDFFVRGRVLYIDRPPRQPFLIGADLGRLGLAVAVPVLWALGRLHMADLYPCSAWSAVSP